MSTEKKILTIRIDLELLEKIRSLAEKKQLSISAYSRMLLIEKLEEID